MWFSVLESAINYLTFMGNRILKFNIFFYCRLFFTENLATFEQKAKTIHKKIMRISKVCFPSKLGN